MGKYRSNKTYNNIDRISSHCSVLGTTIVKLLINRGFEYDYNNKSFISNIDIRNHNMFINIYPYKTWETDDKDTNKQKMIILYNCDITTENWYRSESSDNLATILVRIDQHLKDAHNELYDYSSDEEPEILEIEEKMLSEIKDMI